MKALVTVGTFDGVHRGHQRLVRWMLGRAERLRLRPTVVLFDRPPRFFFHPHLASPLLTTVDERRDILQKMGVAAVKVLPFNRHMAHVPHTRFFEECILRRCHAAAMVVGPDFAFGRSRKGNNEWLSKACRILGMYFAVLPMLRKGSKKIGSTHIRELLMAGEVGEAARLLGRAHFAEGTVVRGDGLGRWLGFPTANLEVPPEKLVPPGVFKVRTFSSDGPKIDRIGVCNVGSRPTVSKEGDRHVEVHIPGFSGSLYGRRFKIEFLRRIRNEVRFPSLEALKEQIRLDVRAARK